ncbi:hypothetical protein [Siccirubricoccus phaeus]|nr:hypothetical protein [Siccirubricoccus phaeus]
MTTGTDGPEPEALIRRILDFRSYKRREHPPILSAMVRDISEGARLEVAE